MPVSIVRDKKTDLNVQAVVEARYKKGLGALFGPRVGSAEVISPKNGACGRIRVVPPVWNEADESVMDILKQCYRKSLQLARQNQWTSMSVPLLAAQDPNFPACFDFKIALDTIREFLAEQDLEVYLLTPRQDAYQMPELRNDVASFLASRYMAGSLWSDVSFGIGDARFNTIPPRSDGYGDMEASSLWGWSDDAYATPAPMAPCPPSAFEERQTGNLPSREELDAMLRSRDAGFSERLLQLIDETGKKDSDIYNKANVSRQLFSKIRNNPDYKPTKPTAIAFAIALELDKDGTLDLIGRAGYTLTTSSVFDNIILYFIQRRNYNMFDINEILFEYDQSLLGA